MTKDTLNRYHNFKVFTATKFSDLTAFTSRTFCSLAEKIGIQPKGANGQFKREEKVLEFWEFRASKFKTRPVDQKVIIPTLNDIFAARVRDQIGQQNDMR